jgi:hypothetical protein
VLKDRIAVVAVAAVAAVAAAQHMAVYIAGVGMILDRE